MWLAEKNREEANIVTPKNGVRSLGLDRTPEALFARAGRESRQESGHIFG